MTKMLPAIVAAGTALITTAMVQAVYALFWLGHYVFDDKASPYDWAGAFAVSGIAIAVVLLASMIALGLMARQSDDEPADNDVPARREATPAVLRIAGTSE